MKRLWQLATLACVFAVTCATVQAGAWSFRWQKGQVLTYRVEHVTKVTEVLGGNRVEMTSRLNVVKRWEIDSVDEQGTATARLQVTSMRNEQTRPNGDTLIFDSDHPDKSTPELHAQLSKFINKTLAVLHVNAQGNVVKTLEGSATQFESDLPFLIHLPGDEVKEGQGWERKYDFALQPPFGTGEKYQAVQQCQVTKLAEGHAHLQVTTTIKDLDLPKGPSEQVPLLSKQPAGEIIFDVASGRVLRAELKIERELKGHQGAGSSYRFESRYTEQLAE